MGKPVICSRTRGQVDVIEEGVTGLFVPVGDEKALRAAMLELWHDPARARDGASRARLRRKEPQPGQVLPRRQRRDRSLARGLPGKGRGLRHALRNGRLTVPPAIRGSTRPATSPIGGKRATFSGPAGVPVVTGPLDRQRAPGPARRRARRKITLRPKRREPPAGSQVGTPRRRRPVGGTAWRPTSRCAATCEAEYAPEIHFIRDPGHARRLAHVLPANCRMNPPRDSTGARGRARRTSRRATLPTCRPKEPDVYGTPYFRHTGSTMAAIWA